MSQMIDVESMIMHAEPGLMVYGRFFAEGAWQSGLFIRENLAHIRPLGVGPDACDVWACPACAYRVSFEQALTGALLVDPGRGRAAYRYRRGLLFPVARHIVARGPRGVTHILDSRCVRLADDNEGEASQNDAGATSLSDLWREEFRGLLGE